MVMWNAHGPGGVARTVLNLANHLSRTREVEVVSVTRRGKGPRFPLSADVRLTYLEDDSERALADLLAARPPSVVVTSRPVLHRSACRGNRGRHVLVGQDHGNFETRMASPWVRGVLAESLAGLDAMTVLTRADAEDYRRTWPAAPARIEVVPNALPFEPVATVPEDSPRVVVAAGRLVPEKGFDRLVTAWAPVARRHPDWQLHLCGQGPSAEDLEGQVDAAGLRGRVHLLGHVDDIRTQLRDAAFLAMASHSEGFAMVLIEAMSQGIPVVAYDCPRGPAELVTDRVNGRLVADGDQVAYTAALTELVEDAELRRTMGAAALEHAQQFRLERVGRQWTDLIDGLCERRARN